MFGDWLTKPADRHVHLGDVYLNGVSMYEAVDMDALRVAERRERGEHFKPVHPDYNERIRYPEQTVYQWYAEVDDLSTVLWCNFGEYDPNKETVEISVRGSCFFPRRTGVNYITVRGFEMAHAATQFAPPTAEQEGLIGPNWSCGWIIENNCLHDSKCCVVSLGKERSTGQNYHTRFMRKSGYHNQMEAVFLAHKLGWSKERIGSHIVRNNEIYNCGQAGIVGHLGCIFSRIEHNLIYNVNTKQEFWGHEIAGIKFHAAIDTVIENNNINNCNLGLWLDWQAQGTRVTRNLFFGNYRDFFIEVTHGPCLVDHNLFLSPISFQNAAQGTAYVHNLICGVAVAYNVLNRATPYHYPHSTDVAGYAFVYGGDDRVINNIIIGAVNPPTDRVRYLGAINDKYSVPEEYMPAIREIGPLHDNDKYFTVPQPVWMEQNAYSGHAKPFRAEVEPISADGMSASVAEENGEWVLTLDVPATVVNASCRSVTTERLGAPRITEESYENADGTPLDLSCDMLGARRSERIIPGAIAELNEGVNRITVWKR
ncbi:MAG: right-handed parallel beta-helix repeat-containing protein [Clostridia bacterium]|nr:right-handed parallel beta-helix repeat-containing protein [Clostridia bacterium]